MLGSSIFLARAAKQGSGGKGGEPLLTAGALWCAIALTVTGCATPPVVKRDYLDATAWRGSALTVVGRQNVVDAAAGAAPQTVTLIDVNQRAEVAGDVERRARVLDRRVANVQESCTATALRPSLSPSGLDRYRSASRPILLANCRRSKWWSSPITDGEHARPVRAC